MKDELSPSPTRTDEVEALARCWPRPIVAAGYAEALAQWWCASRAAAVERGEPPFARRAWTSALRSVLFEARRARWLRRGLEDAEKTLSAQQRGLEQSPAAQVAAGQRRISRLLVVSNDGSARFYREINRLRMLHQVRLEVVLLDCDEFDLGASIFGPGQTARAVLLDHKEAVMEFLHVLHEEGFDDPAPMGMGAKDSS